MPVPWETRGVLGSGGTQGDFLDPVPARGSDVVTVEREVTPAVLAFVTACSGQRAKGAPEAGRKEQREQELIWELGRRAGAVPGGD